MRDGFHKIVSGWALYSGMGDLTERLEVVAEWQKANGPLQPDEEATVKLMIEAQIARGGWSGQEEGYEAVFTHCNVCGIKLRTEDEDRMGMCERCSNE